MPKTWIHRMCPAIFTIFLSFLLMWLKLDFKNHIRPPQRFLLISTITFPFRISLMNIKK